METKQIYILLTIALLSVISVVVILLPASSSNKKLTPLAGLAFSFVLTGALFGDSRFIGYSLIGVGILLSIIDIFMKLKQHK